MTVAARRVLEDCRGAVDEIGNGVQGPAWRRRWVSAVVLLRSVGYVLDSVDSNISDGYRGAIADAWCELKQSKPNPPIFWAFIDNERHNVVHEYEVGAGQGVTVHVGENTWVEHHYVINVGHFAGRDQRHVLREAVAWWDEYLDGIDRASQK